MYPAQNIRQTKAGSEEEEANGKERPALSSSSEVLSEKERLEPRSSSEKPELDSAGKSVPEQKKRNRGPVENRAAKFQLTRRRQRRSRQCQRWTRRRPPPHRNPKPTPPAFILSAVLSAVPVEAREQRKAKTEDCGRRHEKAAALIEAMATVDSPATASSPESVADASRLHPAVAVCCAGRMRLPLSCTASMEQSKVWVGLLRRRLCSGRRCTPRLPPHWTPTPTPPTFIPPWLCAAREDRLGCVLHGVEGAEFGRVCFAAVG